MTTKFVAKDMDEYLDVFYSPKRAAERQSIFGERFGRLIAKADQLTDTDTSTKNVTYGAAVMSYLNYSSEIWSILPKRPAPRQTGFRVLAGDPIGTYATGLQETVQISAGQTIASFVNVEWDMKWMDVAFGISEQNLWRATVDDDVDEWAALREHFGQAHIKGIDNFLGRSNISAGQATYVIESIDRMISSSAEATFLSNADNSALTGATGADVYPYGIRLRRSGFSGAGFGNGPFDSVVDENANTLRAFDLTLLDGVIRQVEMNGATRDGLYILTGYDTADTISQRLEARQRFMTTTHVVNTLNGVQRTSDVGVAGGVDVMSYKGIPIFRSRAIDNLKPSGGISPIFGVYQPDCYIAVGMPTLYLETGQDDWLVLDKLRRKAAFVTAAELIFTRFNRCFKIRDLSV